MLGSSSTVRPASTAASSKTAHIAQERREILVVFGELWVHRDGLSEQSLRLLKIPH